MDKPKTLKITNVNNSVAEDLANIAMNLGVGLSPFLKPKLKEIVDSYPDEMKKPKSRD